MSRLLLIAAGILPLALANPAQAHGPGHSSGGSYHSMSSGSYHSMSGGSYHSMYHGGSSHHFPTGQSYFSRYGTKFSHGYYFGRNNFYWNRSCWCSRYGCYCYWNPYAYGWYYWYAPGSCYYPISYISSAPPTVVAPATPGGAMPPAGPPVP